MAVTVRENYGSREIRTASGSASGIRTYTVYDSSSAITSPDSVYALTGTNGLPTKGDPFPGALLEVSDIAVTPAPDQDDTWIVTYTYTDAAGSMGGNQLQPLDPQYLDVSAEGTVNPLRVWRTHTDAQFAALVASGGTNAFGAQDNDTDIGGTPVDVAGEPIDVLHRVVTLNVTVTKDVRPSLGNLVAYTGRRNSVTFWGAPVGSCLFSHYSVARAAIQRWRVTYQFVVDERYHMRQQPYRLPDGSPALASFASTTGLRSQEVYHVQPFPNTVNFYLIDTAFTGAI